MEYHIIKRFKYTNGDSMYSHIRTEKTIEKAIEKRLYLERLEDAENIVNERLSDFVGSNPDLEKKMGAKAIQGKGYLPGSEEEA